MLAHDTLTHCHRCGLPLAGNEAYCPYCEQEVHHHWFARLMHWRPAHYSGQVRRTRLTPTHVLAAGFVCFTLIAIAALTAAVLAA